MRGWAGLPVDIFIADGAMVDEYDSKDLKEKDDGIYTIETVIFEDHCDFLIFLF